MKIDGSASASQHPIGPAADNDRRVDKAAQSGPGGGSASTIGGADGDQIEISEEAQMASKTQSAAGKDIRPDKVAAARRFLEAGMYNEQGVLEETAKLLESQFRLDA